MDDKADAEFLNITLLHYREMTTLFGNIMVTCNFAKDSSAALGKEDKEGDSLEEEDEVNTHGVPDGVTQEATSSASRPNKKAKTAEIEEEGLVQAFKTLGTNITSVIKMVPNQIMSCLETYLRP